jgi:hypothetical protein
MTLFYGFYFSFYSLRGKLLAPLYEKYLSKLEPGGKIRQKRERKGSLKSVPYFIRN